MKFAANKVCSMKIDATNFSDLFSYQKLMKALKDTQNKLNVLTADLQKSTVATSAIPIGIPG